MSTETIARRYAIALADVVGGSNDAETVRTELKGWKDLIGSSKELQSVFDNPAIAHINKEKVLASLLERAKPSKTTSNFVRVLLQNGRMTDIGEISDRFEAELTTRSGIIAAEITSARALPSDEQAEFQASLERMTGKRVSIDYKIDQEIIGGVVTRIGSTVYDGSVRTKLAMLKEQLVNAK